MRKVSGHIEFSFNELNVPRFFIREVILFFFLGFGVCVLFSTESLSAFKLFSFFPLCVFWAIVFAAVFLFVFISIKQKKISFNSYPFSPLHAADNFFLLIIVILAIFLCLIAFMTPPNTWDAMTYHLARVAHWIQNKTVAFYPTHIERQLYINPFAEYWIAQFLILFKGADQWANMVQWLSMAGSLIGISLIARELGLPRSGQILSVFLVITLPNAIVQSVSTQTDFVATVWIVTAVYFILKNINSPQATNVWAISMAAMLAFYTKGSSLFILVPFWSWMFLGQLRSKHWWHGVLIAATLSVTMLFLLLRNYLSLGNTVFPQEHGHLLALNNLSGIISNLTLHYGMHLRTGFIGTDNVLGECIENMHRLLGMTIQTSPANILALPFNYMEFPFQEDEVPNFLFFMTLLVAGGGGLISKRFEFVTIKGQYYLLAFFCFFIFNAFVKWSPFDGRYHLPFFVLFAPFLADFLGRHRKAMLMAGIVFTLSAAGILYFNQTKPIAGRTNIFSIPREYKYFYAQSQMLDTTITIGDAVALSNCHQLGLIFGEDTWEYPLWAYFRDRQIPMRMEHVLVNNSSNKIPYPLGDFVPCVVISRQNFKSITMADRTYGLLGEIGGFSFYEQALKIN